MGQVVRYQEILRRLAIIDDGFVEDPAGLGLGPGGARVLDPRTAATVDLPAPFAPIRATRRPGGRSRLTRSRAGAFWSS